MIRELIIFNYWI